MKKKIMWGNHTDERIIVRKEERMVALRPHTPKHIRTAGHIILTPSSEPVISYGAENMVTVLSGFLTSDLLITGPTH
jgi:hypothetical protein